MRSGLTLLACFFIAHTHAQTSTSVVDVYDVYSANGLYYMRSIPFDNVEQTIYGSSSVFGLDSPTPLYVLDRYFGIGGGTEQVALSDDGRSIACASRWYADDRVEAQRSVVVYRDGQLVRSYTAAEISDCDNGLEDCYLVYRNDSVLVDDGPKWVNGKRALYFREGTGTEERFANEHALFATGDTLYLIDMRRNVHAISLITGEKSTPVPFANRYAYLENLFKEHRCVVRQFDTPSLYNLPPLTNGRSTRDELAKHLGMVALGDDEKYDGHAFKTYIVRIDALIDRNGRMELLELGDAGLNADNMMTYLEGQLYDLSVVPDVFAKWRVQEYIYLRNRSKAQAKKEHKQDIARQYEAYLKRLDADSIAGVYIPRDLGECFVQLDLLLRPKDRSDMMALTSRSEMIRYHHGLGTSLRNQWYLWGGSRLQQYFTSRGIRHPDEMSHLVLLNYWDWLHGQRESWKTWEQEHPVQPRR